MLIQIIKRKRASSLNGLMLLSRQWAPDKKDGFLHFPLSCHVISSTMIWHSKKALARGYIQSCGHQLLSLVIDPVRGILLQ
jgi:hypothetical protein